MLTCDSGLSRVRTGTGKELLGGAPNSLVSDDVPSDLGTGWLPSEQQGVAGGCQEA